MLDASAAKTAVPKRARKAITKRILVKQWSVNMANERLGLKNGVNFSKNGTKIETRETREKSLIFRESRIHG